MPDDRFGKPARGAHDPVPVGKTPRIGKTARERANGKWARHNSNRAAAAIVNKGRGKK